MRSIARSSIARASVASAAALGAAGGGAAPEPEPELFDGFSQIVFSGQSLAFGTGGNDITVTTAQPYDNVMFTGGLKAGYNAGNQSGFIDLAEATYETGHAMLVNRVIQMIEDEDGLPFGDHGLDFLGTNDAQGNSKIVGLAPRTSSYVGFLRDIGAAKTVADGLSRATRLDAIVYRQGEADQKPDGFPAGTTPSETWKKYLRTFLQLKENDSYRVNPTEAVPVTMIIYQLASHANSGVGGTGGSDPTIAWAIEDLASDATIPIWLSNPLYHLTHADDVHLTGLSYRRQGAAEAYALKRAVIDGAPLPCFSPVSAVRNAAEITLTFELEAGKSLVLDTTAVANPGDYGFTVRDDTDTLMTINSVALVGTNQVLITCSATVPAGSTVYYARNATTANTSGPLTGPRGNLRDDTGDTFTAVISGSPEAVHRWCAIFKRVLS